MPDETKDAGAAASLPLDSSPLAKIWNRVKGNPVVASLIFLVPVVGATMKFGKDVVDFIQKVSPPVVLQEVVKGLASDAPEVRIAAIRQLADSKRRNANDVAVAIRSLESMINRRAPKWPQTDGQSRLDTDIGLAITTLGILTKINDENRLGLKNPTITNVNLAGVDLPSVYLRGFTFLTVNFNGANLLAADFTNSVLRDVQLARIQATGSKLVGASLESSCLEDAILVRADFTNVKAIRSDFNGANMSSAIMVRTILLESRLNGTDLTNANLSGADFSDAKEVSVEQLKRSNMKLGSFIPPSKGWQRFTLSVCG